MPPGCWEFQPLTQAVPTTAAHQAAVQALSSVSCFPKQPLISAPTPLATPERQSLENVATLAQESQGPIIQDSSDTGAVEHWTSHQASPGHHFPVYK